MVWKYTSGGLQHWQGEQQLKIITVCFSPHSLVYPFKAKDALKNVCFPFQLQDTALAHTWLTESMVFKLLPFASWLNHLNFPVAKILAGYKLYISEVNDESPVDR